MIESGSLEYNLVDTYLKSSFMIITNIYEVCSNKRLNFYLRDDHY